MMNKSRRFNYTPALSSYIFIITPFLIMAIVKWTQGAFNDFFMLPDLSLAASIIFGQTIVGLSAALATTDREKKVDGVVLNITVLICLGLLVNMTIYVLMLTIPNKGLAITQAVLFLVSTIVHFNYGAAIAYLNTPKKL